MTDSMSNIGPDQRQISDKATIQILANDDMALVQMWDNLLVQFETHHGLPHQDFSKAVSNTKTEMPNVAELGNAGEQGDNGHAETRENAQATLAAGIERPVDAFDTSTPAQDVEDTGNPDVDK
ncbi:hypothetical protein POJ06DRAFT_7931 [Lipomyces tetrasporus]|uniref:Uncharacterized protein n=1 Tax=Lipomyces tetrasporus TaxID=54092 RepID=A0AAD7QYK4_9ASCO|nr:uncharacterized protein POJ06DRAFT_7931 [Lipomyces tetrasporus]KAJ8103829.1 hypothetical protein POJ06DRAFT_7931 [Lipomyces tetrasporus]